MQTHRHCSYLGKFFRGSAQPIKDTVKEVAEKIRTAIETEKIDPPDYLACTGVSGLLVASPISIELDIPLIVVRKQLSHSNEIVEGIPRGVHFTYLIIDDMTCSGYTIDRIKEKITENGNGHLVGCYFYQDRKLSYYFND